MLLEPPGLILSFIKEKYLKNLPATCQENPSLSPFSYPCSDIFPRDTAQEQQQVNRCRDLELKVCSGSSASTQFPALFAHLEQTLSENRLGISEATDLCLIALSCLFSQCQLVVRFPDSFSVWTLQLLEDNSDRVWHMKAHLYKD